VRQTPVWQVHGGVDAPLHKTIQTELCTHQKVLQNDTKRFNPIFGFGTPGTPIVRHPGLHRSPTSFPGESSSDLGVAQTWIIPPSSYPRGLFSLYRRLPLVARERTFNQKSINPFNRDHQT
jgi:hypothetical protein